MGFVRVLYRRFESFDFLDLERWLGLLFILLEIFFLFYFVLRKSILWIFKDFIFCLNIKLIEIGTGTFWS